MFRRPLVVCSLLAVLPSCLPAMPVTPAPSDSASPAPVVTPSPRNLPAATPSATPSPMSDDDRLRLDCGLYDAALATLTGRITDETGTPVAGVAVVGAIPGAKGGDPCMPETVGKDAIWRATSDKDGVYKLERTRPGSPLLMTASRDGKVFSRMAVMPAVNLQGDRNVNRYDLTWRPTTGDDPALGTLIGRVHDKATYTDLDGLAVTATLTAGRFANGSDSQFAISGPFGRYRFDGVPFDRPMRIEVAHVQGKRVTVGPLKPLDMNQSAPLFVIPF